MAVVINGSGTVTGISVGGLPDGVVDAGTLATNSVDSAELIDGSIDLAHLAADSVDGTKIADDAIDSEHYAAGSIDNSHIDAMAASKLTGALPAISGASLTGLKAGSSYFRAYFDQGANWLNLADATKVAFNGTYVNEGSDFDTTNNRYVAPEDGVYVFYFHIYTAEDDESNGFKWRKNNSAVGLQDTGGIYTAGSWYTATDTMVSASLVVQLDATDYIEVFTQGTADVYSGHSSMGGFRLS